jgi:hypothetical protein
MDGKLQFVSVTGLTFGLIGLSILILLGLHIWVLVRIIQMTKLLVRVIKRNQEAERARREIQERDRKRITQMIRRKVSEEEWIDFLAQLGENDEGEPK